VSASLVQRFVLFLVVLFVAVAPRVVRAEGAAPPPAQGIAVIGLTNARDDAFTLARAIYKSSLRPASLDEIRARVLAGDAPPPNASRDVKELAELRAGVHGDDVASRQLLASLATRTKVRAILVVSVETVAPDNPASVGNDAGADPDASAVAAPVRRVHARLFLAETGDVDAAQYAPDESLSGVDAWQSTVVSLERRFPQAPTTAGPREAVAIAPATLKPEENGKKPFYKSPWLWGGIGAALLLGGFFYFATRDTGDDPIHLEMRVPR